MNLMLIIRYFLELNHHRWLNVYEGKPHPATVAYTIGNPLIAQTIVKHDVRAALNIPLRLLIVENPERPSTSIIYQLPSSVMVLADNPELRDAAKALDLKLENMLTRIARPSEMAKLCKRYFYFNQNCIITYATEGTRVICTSETVVQ